MQKLITIATTLFAIFIVWVLYMANTGQNTIFFDLVKAIPYGDKIGHALLFGILTLGINLTTQCKEVKVFKFRIFFGSLCVFIFTVFEELSQTFFSNRTLDITDFLSNIVGIIIFTFISWRLRRLDKY